MSLNVLVGTRKSASPWLFVPTGCRVSGHRLTIVTLNLKSLGWGGGGGVLRSSLQ